MSVQDSDEEQSSMEVLKKARQYKRAKVTRIYNKLNTDIENLDVPRLIDYKEKLTKMKTDFEQLNVEINSELQSDIDLDQLLEEEEKYDNMISDCFLILHPLIKPPPLERDSDTNVNKGRNRLILPTIEMPIFANEKTDNLEKFLHAFESIIEKHHLSDYEKFVYLRGQVKKGPHALLNSLDAKDQTYTGAKKLLTDAFASPLTQKFSAIRKLTELRLNLNDDVYKFIGSMRSVTCSFSNLKITVEDMLQYFIWQSFNRKFQDQLIQISNSIKPTMTQINDNLFSAAERYIKLNEDVQPKQIKKTEFFGNSRSSNENSTVTNNLAINVKQDWKKFCILCKADSKKCDSHTIKNCTVYSKPSEKITKLKSLNYCTRCGWNNHNADQCKFRFSSSCRVCNKFHMTYLCTRSEPAKVNSNVSCINFNNMIKRDDVLLPTFSIIVEFNGNRILCRTLNDTGSQRNFIHERIVSKLNLKIIEKNLQLNIHGFNTEKQVKTNIVEVPIKINGKINLIKAIVLPAINVSLECTNVNVISEAFINKGYSLADAQLHLAEEKIDFDLIMGPDAVALLSPQAVVFGGISDPSVYLESKVGIMLLGETNSLLNNLKYLPDLNKTKTSEVTVKTSRVEEILADSEEINFEKLQSASNEILEEQSRSYLNYDEVSDSERSEVDGEMAKRILTDIDRAPDGRLVVDLPWNPECKDRLAKNNNLSRKILSSIFKKLTKDNKLQLYDQVFKEQEDLGIIERIENVEQFLEDNPDFSFLPHMPVYKPERETTKIRIVYLSNLAEKLNSGVSHNNALLPGPSLNTKLLISLILARFDRYVLIFDIKKAFLSIQLRPEDQNKLLCWWYKDAMNNDFTPIIYRNLRLTFGLRPSPCILMLALYKILIIDVNDDDTSTISLKRQIYNNMYMDNGIISSNNLDLLKSYYEKIPAIFEAYKFSLQQYATNCSDLQSEIDAQHKVETDLCIKFFGLEWDRGVDTLGPYPISLDSTAKTKRSILSSLNSVYDLFGACLPLLNRAKLYLQKLQTQYDLDWDKELSKELCTEWQNICKQCNSAPKINVKRFVGCRQSSYTLVAFSDASATIYGTVIFIIENETKNVSFLLAKNKLVSTKLPKKTIPTLEFQGLVFASETLIDLYKELCTDKTVDPINVTNLYVYTDSMVCLSWLKGYFVSYDKMQKRSTFIMNRLRNIKELTTVHAITYRFTQGSENPGDCVTRPLSYSSLSKTSFWVGPKSLKDLQFQPDFEVSLPETVDGKSNVNLNTVKISNKISKVDYTIEPERYSSFRKLCRVLGAVLCFIKKLKSKCKKLDSQTIRIRPETVLLLQDQKKYYPEVVEYLKNQNVPLSNIPNLVLQLNLYKDKDGLIRVRSKTNHYHPILLSNKSVTANLIIKDLHETFCHCGVYSTLRELRKRFWIVKGFVTVRKLIRNCIKCKRVNETPIKLSQNSYRDFRENPPKSPFSSIFLDFLGPVNVKYDGNVRKTYVLVITCLWSRAVSLGICVTAETREFLRVLQMHVYNYGMFSSCLSDLGSQITAGATIIKNFLNDNLTEAYFKEHNVTSIKFDHYPKGNSSLGSLVEVMVKQTKHLLVKSIGKNILTFEEFQLLIQKTNHILNRRPLTFKESLRETSTTDLPEPITPEHLIFGRELLSVNIIPALQPEFGEDYSDSDVRTEYSKLRSVINKQNKIYNSEFIAQLVSQSTDKQHRYKPISHKVIKPGDLVLLVEPNTKRSNYPMGKVVDVTINSIEEVTEAKVLKSNGEIVKRHSTSIIPIISVDYVENSKQMCRQPKFFKSFRKFK